MSFANKSRMMETIVDDLIRVPEHQWGWAADPLAAAEQRFLTGRFLNLDHLFLRWRDESWFEYLPHPEADKRFAFRRHTGETITPGHMFTDGGSIPRRLWAKQGLSPWDYGPAFLVHDWEFDLHYCGRGTKSFEAVRDTMMEGVRTLMDEGYGSGRPLVFRALYAGINSPVARRLWNGMPGSTLPE